MKLILRGIIKTIIGIAALTLVNACMTVAQIAYVEPEPGPEDGIVVEEGEFYEHCEPFLANILGNGLQDYRKGTGKDTLENVNLKFTVNFMSCIELRHYREGSAEQ